MIKNFTGLDFIVQYGFLTSQYFAELIIQKVRMMKSKNIDESLPYIEKI